ncbi:MAG TPA: E2/UBC family protein [Methylomirabilota bacterium]|nr:E2/UBC family protein [Methylomirabilota bacterium]
MIERRREELRLVEAKYGELEVDPNFEWFIIKRWGLGRGWNVTDTPVLVLFPPGYPITPPDNFYTRNDLKLAAAGEPGNTSPNVNQAGRTWRQFSWHVEAGDWRPHAEVLKGHNMLTFLDGVSQRLNEAS